MIQPIKEFAQNGVVVRFLDGRFNTEGTMGKMVVTILSVVAQDEREQIRNEPTKGGWKPMRKVFAS